MQATRGNLAVYLLPDTSAQSITKDKGPLRLPSALQNEICTPYPAADAQDLQLQDVPAEAGWQQIH